MFSSKDLTGAVVGTIIILVFLGFILGGVVSLIGWLIWG